MVRAKQDVSEVPIARRDFLIKSGALVGTAALLLTDSKLATAETASTASLDPNLPLEIPQWTRSLGAPTASPYGKPSKFETKAVRNLYPGLKDTMSAYSTSPLQELDGIITPNGLFYERHHAGVPETNPAEHRLLI
ncbi:hypothetical protein ALP39_200195 [Pseudomonas marginalis pv. marginalis]|nr:hypothetical protein ALP39_200195 [Pseudomonas marginalis pv. marginalis]